VIYDRLGKPELHIDYRKNKINELRRQIEEKDTFKPNCNLNKNYRIEIPFEERQKLYRDKSANKRMQVIHEMNQNETKGKQFFKPQTNMTQRVKKIKLSILPQMISLHIFIIKKTNIKKIKKLLKKPKSKNLLIREQNS
jgi:hypothetical protein